MRVDNINKIYSVGIYIRLSREDSDKQDIVSESINNQKSLLDQYVKENNLNVIDYYIDDGYSGTNFDRPAFKRLIQDIENKKINMVITKDMSRLGRDYIGTGNLIEKYFPENNIRYIAVTDNIDTFLDNSNNDIAPFKAIMNDMYAKDISKKIRSSLTAKMKEGKFVGSRAPFGYAADPKDKNHLIVNESKAVIVRRIFNLSLEGLSYFKIAKKLSCENVLTPAQYYSFKWKNKYNEKNGGWHPKTIQDILTNRIYIGDMVQSRRKKVNYKVKKIVKNNPNDYIVVENTHEAIIDKDIFYEVQKRLPKNVGRCEKKEQYLLDGLLYCGDCGNRISVGPRRKKDNNCYTMCNYYRSYIKRNVCTMHSNNYDKLEKSIVNELKCICKNYIKDQNIKNNVLKNIDLSDKEISKKELNILNNEINNLKDNLDNIYLDKINKNLDNEQYLRIKFKLDNSLKNKQIRYDEVYQSMNNLKVIESEKKQIDNYIKEFLSLNKINRELVLNLIQKINIYEDKTIDLIVTFVK